MTTKIDQKKLCEIKIKNFHLKKVQQTINLKIRKQDKEIFKD
jgi:hypothetical protein